MRATQTGSAFFISFTDMRYDCPLQNRCSTQNIVRANRKEGRLKELARVGGGWRCTESSERQSSPVTGPAVQCKQFTAALVLFAEVLGHAATNLGDGTPHYSAEISLWIRHQLHGCELEGRGWGLRLQGLT